MAMTAPDTDHAAAIQGQLDNIPVRDGDHISSVSKARIIEHADALQAERDEARKALAAERKKVERLSVSVEVAHEDIKTGENLLEVWEKRRALLHDALYLAGEYIEVLESGVTPSHPSRVGLRAAYRDAVANLPESEVTT